MKSAKYYLERADQMLEFAKNASGEEGKKGFIKAADAYRALAETAEKVGAKIREPDKE